MNFKASKKIFEKVYSPDHNVFNIINSMLEECKVR